MIEFQVSVSGPSSHPLSSLDRNQVNRTYQIQRQRSPNGEAKGQRDGLDGTLVANFGEQFDASIDIVLAQIGVEGCIGSLMGQREVVVGQALHVRLEQCLEWRPFGWLVSIATAASG